jgi:hypothetical protein
MKRNLQHTVFIISAALIFSLALFTNNAMAQDEDRLERNDPQDQGLNDPGRDPDNPLPLDGGLSLLLAAGAAYGGKKLVDQRKNRKDK